MPFFDELLHDTADQRLALQTVPVIQACLAGQVARDTYEAFLREAYHHVRHTVPLLAACRQHLPSRIAWLRGALAEYIEEEQGHDEWILDDLRACGVDAESVRASPPGAATARMVAHAYHVVEGDNPAGFFGMVHVLEGTSVALALAAARNIQQALGLPDTAFGYLRSHGTLDQEHTRHFAELMNRLADPRDQQAVVRRAREFYGLYADIFRGLPTVAAEGGAP
ncbi:iron-containing redox enzyme family protein [Pigmentiphaga sp. CHJ604]|uniref:TenA family transcriptional regulator n=1 Tax=Pigmentiphaga sp. CHJ604 TaxID=3081984 RepID=UPI0030D5F422